MAKKEVKKVILKKQDNNDHLIKILVENSVSLQKVVLDLSSRLDNLSHQISKLLDLFESSAKTVVEKEFGYNKETKDIINKLNELLEQNKIIARGLTLLHSSPNLSQAQTQMPQQNSFNQEQPSLRKEGDYQKSISSRSNI